MNSLRFPMLAAIIAAGALGSPAQAQEREPEEQPSTMQAEADEPAEGEERPAEVDEATRRRAEVARMRRRAARMRARRRMRISVDVVDPDAPIDDVISRIRRRRAARREAVMEAVEGATPPRGDLSMGQTMGPPRTSPMARARRRAMRANPAAAAALRERAQRQRERAARLREARRRLRTTR